eukprot:TRINITY_DN29020_c0_g2_i1.p1 TRINITY_DN29020_c0_g2~~TRINITY_DN29020_c0_g2_i1.p1  ORF type:complete len:465 (+),score=99.93 TRINITY_DN29020_c0_g2_i1:40-1434(+)
MATPDALARAASADAIERDGQILAAVYTALAAFCLITVLVRALAARHCDLPLTASHIAFLLLLLVLFVVRVASDLWEPGDGRLVEAGADKWLYNLMCTGPLVLFLTLFLVLLYHLTCVLHSINLAFENIEAAYFSRSISLPGDTIAASPEAARKAFACVRCQGMAFLTRFRCSLVVAAVALWFLFGVAYAATLVAKDTSSNRLSLLLTAAVETPLFVVCAATGICLLAAALQLLWRLRRLKQMLRDNAVVAALHAAGEAPPEEGRLDFNASISSVSIEDTAALQGAASTEGSKAPEAPVQTSARPRIQSTPSVADSCSRSAPHRSSSVLTASDVYAQPGLPQVEPVLGSVKRILAVTTACMAAFLFRAACLLYLCCTCQQYWPEPLILPYYIVSEAAPAALLLLLYLLPGLEAACFALQARRAGFDGRNRGSTRPSVLESEVATMSRASFAGLRAGEGSQAMLG